MDFFSSEEIVASLGDKAKMKGKLSFVRLCILGIMAGFCIALGYLAFIRITGTAPTEWGSFNNFLGGALFPVGLIALTFVGGELATGNIMVMTLGVLQKKVRVGALCIVGLTEGAFLDKTVAVAQAKIADPPIVAFVSGIGCNIFVCLAVYLGALAKSYLGKMFGLWFPVMVFVVCGFQHVVANAFIIPAAIFSQSTTISWWDYLQNTLWVFLGNAVGGSLFMAVPLIFMTKPATVKPRVEKTIQTEELYGN